MSQLAKELKYSLYLTVHPFKGFWEIKHEKQGSLKTGSILLTLFILLSIAKEFYTGYLFNTTGGLNFNIYQSVGTTLLLFFLWCISNWCLTSLFDGEGTFKDICTATAYALVPMIIIQLILIPLSNMIALQEASFYTAILNLGLIWSGFLIFTGTLVTHQYSVKKTVLIMICTIFGMCIMSYIILLFFNLIQQIAGFASTFWKELMLRMS